VKIAVSGASGYIGRQVLAELARHPVEVVAIARDASCIAVGPRVAVVAMDLAAPPGQAWARLGRPDVLMHLAWEGLPHYDAARHVEVEGPRQLAFLRGLLADGLPALLVTGTCLEYGMQAGALHEGLPAAPATHYAIAKDQLRRELQALRAAGRFAFSWARLFYSYGPGQAAGSLLPQLAAAVARGDQRFNMSGGEQLRDYLPVAEVARLLVALAMRRCDAGVVNVCSGRPVRVRDLVDSWIALNHWQIAPNPGHYPYPDYEPMAFWGERRRLDALLAAD
jgi:dTDP-6-deoxy-L-talose 4-dehydrogenase (NAD+)